MRSGSSAGSFELRAKHSMSKARLFLDYPNPDTAENENTIITNYWLEYVAASDERDQASPARPAEVELRDRLRDFQQEMDAVIRDGENLRNALESVHFELKTGASGCGSFLGRLSLPNGTPAALNGDLLRSSDNFLATPFDLAGKDEGPASAPFASAFGNLLQKLLGK